MGTRRAWYLASAAVVAFACLPSAVATAASLEEEMQELIESHPQIQSKTKSVSSAEQGIRGARSGFLPTAKLGGDEGYEYIDSPDRRLTQGRPFSNKRNTASLTVTQKIFDGFATDAAVDAAKTSHQISTSDLRATRQSTLLEGAAAYLDILRQTKLVALSRENERKVSEQLNLEDERVQKGSGIASDVLAAKQRLQIAKERRVNYEGAFQTAVAKYVQVFGHAPNVATLSDPPLPLDLIPETVEDSLEIAEKGNPSLESSTKTIDLSNERRRAAEAGYWPTLDVVGKADYENGKNGVIGPRRDWSILLVANWELFSGFKTDAQVAQASWDHAASKDNRLYTSRKVSEAVRTSWHKLQTARQRLDLLDNAATLAEEVWEAQKKKREAGKATVQEVLDEETKINEARISYTGAFYDMYQASYELLSGMGRLEVEGLIRAKPAQAPVLSPATSRELTRPLARTSSVLLPAAPQAVKTEPAPVAVRPATPTIAHPTEPAAVGQHHADQAMAANTAMTERVRNLMTTKDEFWTVQR
ncbi:MAG: TolC family outer membrane protein [Phaeospirillum sp.]|nr:TolC family outer membrane protein [Phaeospirillum sp.]